jgi:polysaccharide deacetylase family protein (PEP-CTERM system associated)
MVTVSSPQDTLPRSGHGERTNGVRPMRIILSFDVEEHDRIEAAASLSVAPELKAHYRARLEPPTRWLLDELEKQEIRATFFLVGQIAQHNPGLIRAIHEAGHEVASHGWDHQRVHNFTPETFRADVRQSCAALEQITGTPVRGYRAPTFSIVQQTAWAIEVLAELGLAYDSSIYPVRHDRYGMPQAPRTPFRACHGQQSMLEIPPATLRVLGSNIPVGGGGYFRLLPLFLLERAMEQVPESCRCAVTMLYFHPWEFDPRQARLPLKFLSQWRTYVGIHRSRPRLATLMSRPARTQFARACDVAKELEGQSLPSFHLAG